MDYGRFLMERDLINDIKYNGLFNWFNRNSKFMDINMSMEKNKNIIIFPKKYKGKREVKIPDYDVMELNEDMAFADNLTEGLIVQVVHMMSENGIKVTSKPFIYLINYFTCLIFSTFFIGFYFQYKLVLSMIELEKKIDKKLI